MKVVLSADGAAEGRSAVQWCTDHLAKDSIVIVVVAVNGVGEFVLGLPGFEGTLEEDRLVDDAQRDCCAPLRAAGLQATVRLVHSMEGHALAEVASTERADLLVIGKRPHSHWGDLAHRGLAMALIHHPPCPVVVVPTAPALATAQR